MTDSPPQNSIKEKDGFEVEHREAPTEDAQGNLEYTEDVEPALHARTYMALFALFLLNMVQLVALNGRPSGLAYIAEDVKGGTDKVWVATSLSLVQAVSGPLISFASDTFQARKMILIGTCTCSFVGAAIAPGATSIYRVVGAQIMIGVGFGSVPLAYAIPSEILPRKWRSLAQSLNNVAAGLGAVIAPVVMGALIKKSAHTGWRNFYWIQMALWGLTVVGIVVGYRPPKRHTELDHLSFTEKLARLDLPGMALLATGLTLLLVGLQLGGNPWAWTNARVLSTLVLGIVFLIAFCLYEWKGTSTGILSHELFQRRTFAVCIPLMFIEGILLFAIIIFYPAVTAAFFEQDPLRAGARQIPFWGIGGLVTIGYGLWSSKRRTIRSPLIVGFFLWMAGTVGMATIEANQSVNHVVFNGLCGLGFGGPLILLISCAQLAVPHHLIATATAVMTSSRAVAAAMFTAIYSAAVGSSETSKMPSYIAKAAVGAGLPQASVSEFVHAMLSKNTAVLEKLGTPAILAAAKKASLHATADSFRLVYIIAAPFGLVACILAWFIEDMTTLMTYHVDAPVEVLHAKGWTEEHHENHS